MNTKEAAIGSIVSIDITTDHTEQLLDFYTQVIGWQPEEMALTDEDGDYKDYVMKDAAQNWTGGICHARGVNKGIPPQWIVYINVADIQQSVESCKSLGGKVIKEARNKNGDYIYAMLQDPSGAVFAVTRS